MCKENIFVFIGSFKQKVQHVLKRDLKTLFFYFSHVSEQNAFDTKTVDNYNYRMRIFFSI